MMLQINHISKTINGRKVLRGINFSVKRGSILGIVGHNGAGKTTLLRIMTGLVLPDSGSVEIAGQRVIYDDYQIRNKIGYMPEESGIYKRLNVRDNLAFPLRFYPDIADPDSRINNGLERFDLTDRQFDRTGKLSAGMRRKILFLKSVLHRPEILLLDEPFNGFDVESRQEEVNIINEILEAGGIVCICSHSTGELEKICTHYLFIKEGRMIFNGSRSEVYHNINISDQEPLAVVYLKYMEGP
jgi:ABC-2 type transport system ATP-binding protein